MNEALKKIEAEKGHNLDELRDMLSVWARYAPEKAPALILATDKSMEKCLDFMKSKAKPKAKNGCYHPKPEEALAWVLEYYGLTADEAQAEIEGGLMYAIMKEEAERWKPFEDRAQLTPAPEIPKPQTPAEDIFGGMLDDL